MFGGRAFMVNGKLAFSALAQGDLLVRCDPEPQRLVKLLALPGAEPAEMSGRKMGRGWLRVRGDGIESDEDLRFWIELAVRYIDQGSSGCHL